MGTSFVLSNRDMFSAEVLYARDIASFSKIPPDEQAPFVDRARCGDMNARQDIIYSLLPYVQYLATKYAALCKVDGRFTIEYLDLVQIGNVELVEVFEKAIVHPCPFGYLARAVSGVIMRHCLKHATAIVTPQGKGGRFLAPISIESYDLPLDNEKDGEQWTLRECIEAPSSCSEQERDYSILYSALDKLTPSQRDVVKMYYGIDCAPTDLFTLSCQIRQHQETPFNSSASAAYKLHNRGLVALRTMLGDDPSSLENDFSEVSIAS